MSLDLYAKIDKSIPEYDTIDGAYSDWSRGDRIKQCTEQTNVVFHWNITHNLTKMATAIPVNFQGSKITLYNIVWHPEGLLKDDNITAQQLEKSLWEGFRYMIDHEEDLSKLNPENGWGSFQRLFDLVANYLRICHLYPNAIITASC